METPLAHRLFYFFPVLFCFVLPFGTFVLSVITALWFIVSLFNFKTANFKKGIKHPGFIWIALFFILTCMSAAMSSNIPEALSAIEIKLTFIIFPYLFFCFEWPLGILKRCVISFVSGCFFACLYLIIRALVYALNGHPEYFFYSQFSDLIHASYFAMYLILAIAFVIILYSTWFGAQKNILYSSYFFVIVFIACIFLCSSKLGLISLFISLPAIFIYKYRHKLNIRMAAAALVCLLLAVYVLSKVLPAPFERMRSIFAVTGKQIDKTSSESTTVRILIWQQSIGIIKNHPLFGTGVGDANDELYESYRENGLTGAYEHRLNAHSQYFQTFIGMGLVGFLGLLMLTFRPLVSSIGRKQFLPFVFFFLIVLNFFVESMLQTVAGVLFVAFFYCFFSLVNEKQLSLD